MVSSIIVSIATHFSSASLLIVGFLKDGKSAKIDSNLSTSIFNFKPTLDADSNADVKSKAIVSIFFFFQGSFKASLLATNTVFVVSKVSTIRSLFALSELPVSVRSTIASTKSGTFISVAPQENSTSALTPFCSKNALVVLTISVAIRLPSKSLTVFTSDASGTQSTQRDFLLEARL